MTTDGTNGRHDGLNGMDGDTERTMDGNGHDRLDPKRMSVAELLRAAADDELCPEGKKCLEEHLGEHPEAASQVEFEKALKRCCGRVMSQDTRCTEALRAKISAMAIESRDEDVSESVVEAMGARTRERSFWSRTPVMGALAAVLVLAGGALIVQSVGVAKTGALQGGGTTSVVNYAERMGDFVAREHVRCSVEQAANAKFDERDLRSAVARFSDEFARPVAIPESVGEELGDTGVELLFYGGGACHVPSTSSSAHLRFDARDGLGGEDVRVSLFIAPDPGLLSIEEGVTYKVDSEACAEHGESLYVWTEDGVLYLLVSEADESLCAPVRSLMRAPDEVRSL